MRKLSVSTVLCVSLLVGGAAPAWGLIGEDDTTSGWHKPATRYLVDKGWLNPDSFSANDTMSRRRFATLIDKIFGPGLASRGTGKVTAAEVDAVLVDALGQMPVAKKLQNISSPDGWKPALPSYFGTEILARNMGLRHDRPTTEETYEASANDPMSQADIVYGIWKAKTGASTYAAAAFENFSLPNLSAKKRKVFQYALSLVGTPYVWGGEWPSATPVGYPYGAQVHGGADCSGFTWLVLAKANAVWDPANRPYPGWSLPERSSSDMAAATPRADRLGFRKLKAGDALFFASEGRDANASGVYHVGVYMGGGWMIHSSGSRAGVSIDFIGAGSWWRDQFAWGRRVIS